MFSCRKKKNCDMDGHRILTLSFVFISRLISIIFQLVHVFYTVLIHRACQVGALFNNNGTIKNTHRIGGNRKHS